MRETTMHDATAIAEHLDAAPAEPQSPDTGGSAATGTDFNARPNPSSAEAWPDDWRAQLAEGDQRLEKRLGRFASPRNVVDSLLSAEQRLRGGRSNGPPDGDDAEALAEWRQANGVPETYDAYAIELPDGMVLGEADRPVVDGFLEAAHAANLTSAQVNQALGWYYRQHDAMLAEQTSADQAAHAETMNALRDAWGRDLPAAVNQVHAFLHSLGSHIGSLQSP